MPLCIMVSRGKWKSHMILRTGIEACFQIIIVTCWLWQRNSPYTTMTGQYAFIRDLTGSVLFKHISPALLEFS